MSRPDALAAEGRIIARLHDQLPDVPVFPGRELAQMSLATAPTPAIHVLYRGFSVGDEPPPGRVRLRQKWATVVAVRSARGAKTGAGARAEAGPIVGAVICALDRLPLGDEFSPLHLDEGPVPLLEGADGFFPLIWTVTQTIQTRR